jgi:glycosyltransferase involved in cell wall biosynthesis
MALSITAIVCAHNEARYLSACLHSLLAQSRVPDHILVVNNASTDDTRAVALAFDFAQAIPTLRLAQDRPDHRRGASDGRALQIPSVHVVDEPRKGLPRARETGRRAATGDLLVFLDADCRAPLTWVERVERHFLRDPKLLALSAPYRFYDWDWWGRLLVRAYDFTVAPATQFLVKYLLRIGTVFYGGNFAVRREALERIGGFDTSIAFHGEDTNVGRRLAAIGKVSLFHDCYLYTSARRYVAMGKGTVFRIYIRNFTSELLRHRPRDTTHIDVRI